MQGYISACIRVGAPAPYTLLTASGMSEKFSSQNTANLPSTRTRPYTPKGWPTQLDAVETWQNKYAKHALHIFMKQTHYSIGVEHYTLGIIRSVVYERPVK